MNDTPETDQEEADASQLYGGESHGPSGYVPIDHARRLERQRDKLIAWKRELVHQRDEGLVQNLARAEILNDIADALDMPTGSADEEIGKAAREAIRQRDHLRAWKQEAMAVEATWNNQAVAKLIGVPLGHAIRPAIEPAIRELIQQCDAYAETLRVIATANDRSHHRAAFTDLIRERHPELADDADLDEPLGPACQLDDPQCDACN